MLPEPGGIRTLPPEFSPSLTLRIDGIGRINGFLERDDELIALTSDASYSITGIGPDPTGGNGSFQVATISTVVGTLDQRSLCLTPAGIFGQNRHGLYLHSPGGGFEYLELGAKVADVIRTGGNIRAATYLPDRAAVRFVTNGAPTAEPLVLELDLVHMRWSVHPLALADLPNGTNAGCTAVGGCSWLGADKTLHHVVVQQNALLVERSTADATPWADENRTGLLAVPLRVRLRPIHLDGINGFVLLRRVGLAFEKPDESGVQATHYAWRDGRYEDAAGEVLTWPSPAPERPPSYGPRRQKCAAFWIDLEELPEVPGLGLDPVVPYTENIRIVGIHCEVGVKRGLRKA
jgi:hypothetical protein